MTVKVRRPIEMNFPEFGCKTGLRLGFGLGFSLCFGLRLGFGLHLDFGLRLEFDLRFCLRLVLVYFWVSVCIWVLVSCRVEVDGDCTGTPAHRDVLPVRGGLDERVRQGPGQGRSLRGLHPVDQSDHQRRLRLSRTQSVLTHLALICLQFTHFIISLILLLNSFLILQSGYPFLEQFSSLDCIHSSNNFLLFIASQNE